MILLGEGTDKVNFKVAQSSERSEYSEYTGDGYTELNMIGRGQTARPITQRQTKWPTYTPSQFVAIGASGGRRAEKLVPASVKLPNRHATDRTVMQQKCHSDITDDLFPCWFPQGYPGRPGRPGYKGSPGHKVS